MNIFRSSFILIFIFSFSSLRSMDEEALLAIERFNDEPVDTKIILLDWMCERLQEYILNPPGVSYEEQELLRALNNLNKYLNDLKNPGSTLNDIEIKRIEVNYNRICELNANDNCKLSVKILKDILYDLSIAHEGQFKQFFRRYGKKLAIGSSLAAMVLMISYVIYCTDGHEGSGFCLAHHNYTGNDDGACYDMSCSRW